MRAKTRGIPVARAGEYSKHAAECRVLARNVNNEQHRTQLLNMRDAWENFAVENEPAARGRLCAETRKGSIADGIDRLRTSEELVSPISGPMLL